MSKSPERCWLNSRVFMMFCRGGAASANAMLMLKSLVTKKGWCMVGCPSVNGNARRIGRIEDVESVCFEFFRLDPFMPTSA